MITVDNNLTVDGGKGIVRAWNSTQLKYYTQQAAFFDVGLPAFGTSIEQNIAWSAGLFTSPPKVMVGDIVTSGGTTGTLYRLQLVIYA